MIKLENPTMQTVRKEAQKHSRLANTPLAFIKNAQFNTKIR